MHLAIIFYLIANAILAVSLTPGRTPGTLLKRIAGSRPSTGPHPRPFYFVRDGATWRASNNTEWDSSFDEIAAGIHESPPSAARVDVFWPAIEDSGVWSPVVVTTTARGTPLWLPQPGLTPADLLQLNACLADLLKVSRTELTHAEIDAVVAGVPHTRVSVLWILNDLSVVASFAIVFYGQVRGFFECRASRRLAQGLCPRCTYSLSDLTSPHCPECGTPIPSFHNASTPASSP